MIFLLRQFRQLKNWWNRLDAEPVGNRITKLNALSSWIMVAVSTTLAVLTFNQSQRIEGMTNLINKQDSTIQILISLSNDNKDLIYQNIVMISRLDTNQRYLSEQIQATKLQTNSYQYSTRPVLALDQGPIITQSDNDTTQYSVKILYKNFGFRPASHVKVNYIWIPLSVDNLIEAPNQESIGLIVPNQQMESVITLDFYDRKVLAEFTKWYLIVTFSFTDTLTNKRYESTFYWKQFKRFNEINTTVLGLSMLPRNDEIHLLNFLKSRGLK